jgi:hypothetical protein
MRSPSLASISVRAVPEKQRQVNMARPLTLFKKLFRILMPESITFLEAGRIHTERSAQCTFAGQMSGRIGVA